MPGEQHQLLQSEKQQNGKQGFRESQAEDEGVGICVHAQGDGGCEHTAVQRKALIDFEDPTPVWMEYSFLLLHQSVFISQTFSR